MASPPMTTTGMMKKYKGVRLRRWGKWVSEIRLPNSRERIWLGSYDTPEKAARAFDAAFVCLRGAGAATKDGTINFPDSPPDPVGVARRTNDPEEVYAAAVSHANRSPAPSPSSSRGLAAALPLGLGEPHQVVQEEAAIIRGNVVVLPSTGSFDLEQLLANQPLYSPSHGYAHGLPLPAGPTTAGSSEEDDEGTCDGLWGFDPCF